MGRKKWTAQINTSDGLFQFREKRKWQIALRRYVLEKNKSSFYAPYFGLSIDKFRQWIEIQFDEKCTWENFSKAWQFDHIVPVAYFDFTKEEDLLLCWHFTNITIDRIHDDSNNRKIDILGAKAYFQSLLKKTDYQICLKMIEKISAMEISQIANSRILEQFIIENKADLDKLPSFSSYDYDKLNTGSEIGHIIYEKEFLKKFNG
ncbi:MAG: hypothetical protein ACJ749_09415 [Flavisolibacter sp.]